MREVRNDSHLLFRPSSIGWPGGYLTAEAAEAM